MQPKLKSQKSKEERLQAIKQLDKIKQEDISKDIANLKLAAERLGRKAQSAFSAAKSKKVSSDSDNLVDILIKLNEKTNH